MHRVGPFFILCFIVSLQACSFFGKSDGAVPETNESELYQKAQSQLNARLWGNAIKTLQALEANHPFGRYAQQSQLELIYAYYKNNEPEASNATADRFIRLHPDHPRVDYAYYMKGLSRFTENRSFFGRFVSTDLSKRDPGNAAQSFDYFNDLVTRFPDSEYTPDAIKRMEYLRNLLARNEIHIANYYFEREAYLAATNRGKYVVENFQKTPAVPDALAVMAQGYHLLGLNDLSNDSIRVLKANFPDYPAFDREGNFNFQYKLKNSPSLLSRLSLGFFDKQRPPTYDTRSKYNSVK